MSDVRRTLSLLIIELNAVAKVVRDDHWEHLMIEYSFMLEGMIRNEVEYTLLDIDDVWLHGKRFTAEVNRDEYLTCFSNLCSSEL